MKRKPIILRLRDLPWRRLSRLAFRTMLQCQRLLRHIGPQPVTRIRWDEFQNKLQSFIPFEYADLVLGFYDEPTPSLSALIAKAEALQNFDRVFAIEGIGYRLAKWNLERYSPSERLPFLQIYEGLRPGILVLLHAGLGLALAEWVFGLTDDCESEISTLLEYFTRLCHRNAQPGYEGIAFEALGFIAQALYPSFIQEIDQGLSGNEEALRYFWHGVGRGIYFAPQNASPFRSAPWRAVETCSRLTPDEQARQDAMAGLAWAFIAANLSQPEIVASFMKHHAKEVTANIGFVSGVASAAMFWQEVCPGDARLAPLLQYDPAKVGLASDIWNQYVRSPWEDGLNNRSLLRQVASPEELFRVKVAASKKRKGA